eukprot:3619346-Prymnesium_polylepis.1
MSSRAHSTWPWWQATCRGVHLLNPSFVIRSTDALAAISSCASLPCPCSHVMCRGVAPVFVA